LRPSGPSLTQSSYWCECSERTPAGSVNATDSICLLPLVNKQACAAQQAVQARRRHPLRAMCPVCNSAAQSSGEQSADAVQPLQVAKAAECDLCTRGCGHRGLDWTTLRLLRRYAAFRAQQLRCPGGPCVSQTEQRKDVRLYYGTYDPETTAYLHQEQEWSEQNVRVINVYSGDKNYYVQDAFSKVGLTSYLVRSWICVDCCGAHLCGLPTCRPIACLARIASQAVPAGLTTAVNNTAGWSSGRQHSRRDSHRPEGDVSGSQQRVDSSGRDGRQDTDQLLAIVTRLHGWFALLCQV
jgi:hypothetical protein